jgi:hypothetical protein
MLFASAVKSRLALAILLLSFSAFYLSVELLLIANRQILGPQGFANTFELFLISFLNLGPSGIFAFVVVSVLPRSIVSKHNEDELISSQPTSVISSEPRVASLYTTFNDFMENYALYNLTEARRRGRKFFILDDSTDKTKLAQIDEFAEEYSCEIVRRENRKGYKAGAINAWIKNYGTQYDYIFILDSDSQASAAAIDYCVTLAQKDSKLALVQTKTMTMTSTPNRLTKSGVTIQHAYMAIVQAAMKNLGTTPFYGHNALLKIEALRSIGGLIEESNEDYKTLARLQNSGYESMYAGNSVTYEEIPPDYFSNRKRSLRWARDAVGQLGLLRYKLPGAMLFYLVYGWATYMANLALLAFFLLLAYNGFLPLQPGGGAYFTEMAGALTMTVTVLWPLLSLRVRDPELTVKKILTSVVWGSVFNMPMMGAISVQIVKTSISQIYVRALSLLNGARSKLIEEFLVTPKVAARNKRFASVLFSLKTEIIVGLLPFAVAIIAGSVYFLLFSSIQLAVLIALPVMIFLDGVRYASKPRQSAIHSSSLPQRDYVGWRNYARLRNDAIPPQNVPYLQAMGHRIR